MKIFVAVCAVVIAMLCLLSSNALANPRTIAYVNANVGSVDETLADASGNASSQATETHWSGDAVGNAYAQLSESGISIGTDIRVETMLGRNFMAKGEIWDTFMLSGSGDTVDALVNLRLSGDMYISPSFIGSAHNATIVDVYFRQNNTLLDGNTYWFQVDARTDTAKPTSHSLPEAGPNAVIWTQLSAGDIFPYDGWLASFSNYPIQVNATDLPLNTDLEYRFRLRSQIFGGPGFNDFSSTLTFDPNTPIEYGVIEIVNEQEIFTAFADQSVFAMTSGSGFGNGDQPEPPETPVPPANTNAVPEPSTLALLLSAFLMSAGFIRKNKI